MKDKIFLRIERNGVNASYYNQVVELVSKLGLSPIESIKFAIVYTNKTLDESEIDNAKRKYK